MGHLVAVASYELLIRSPKSQQEFGGHACESLSDLNKSSKLAPLCGVAS